MRALILLLILANAGFFAWQQSLLPWLPWQPEQYRPSSSMTNHFLTEDEPDLPTLVLVGEPVPSILTAATTTSTTGKVGTETDNDNSTKTAGLMTVAALDAGTDTMETTIAEEATTSEQPPNRVSASMLSSDALQIFSNLAEQTEKGLSGLLHPPVIPVNDRHAEEATTAVDHVQAEKPASRSSSVTVTALEQTVADMMIGPPEPPITPSSPSASAPEIQQAEAIPVALSTPLSAQAVCFESGPYDSQAKAEKANEWLTQHQPELETALEKRKHKALLSAWIYLPPQQSRATAEQTVRQLSQLGLQGQTIVSTAPYRNAISLGRYREEQQLERRLHFLADRGFSQVQVEKRYRGVTSYWLTAHAKKNNQLQVAEFRQTFPATGLKLINCK